MMTNVVSVNNIQHWLNQTAIIMHQIHLWLPANVMATLLSEHVRCAILITLRLICYDNKYP